MIGTQFLSIKIKFFWSYRPLCQSISIYKIVNMMHYTLTSLTSISWWCDSKLRILFLQSFHGMSSVCVVWWHLFLEDFSWPLPSPMSSNICRTPLPLPLPIRLRLQLPKPLFRPFQTLGGSLESLVMPLICIRYPVICVSNQSRHLTTICNVWFMVPSNECVIIPSVDKSMAMFLFFSFYYFELL